MVALGATAARSLTGRPVTIGKVRGQALALADGTRLFVTVHPSSLLRMDDDAQRHAAYRAFVDDLKAARAGETFGQPRGAATRGRTRPAPRRSPGLEGRRS